MKNLLALSLVLLASTAIAMERPVAPAAPVATEAIAKGATQAAQGVAGAACDKDCQHGFLHSVQGVFNDSVTFANAQWAHVTKTAATLKSNGWTGLNKNEKIGVAVAGAAIVATTAYLICKLYKAVTKTDKNSKVCPNGRQARC